MVAFFLFKIRRLFAARLPDPPFLGDAIEQQRIHDEGALGSITHRTSTGRIRMLALYFAPGACSMAAHIVLEESGEKYEPLQVDLAGGEQRSEAYLKINPQGPV